MSRAFPISERLSLNVLTALESVTEAAGYNVTLKVSRFKRKPDPAEDLAAILHEMAPRAASDADTPQQRKAWWAQYELMIYVFEPQIPDAPAFDQRCNIARADAERAITKDPTFGGMARKTRILDPLCFEDSTDAGGVVVNFECLYIHLWNNPYSINGE